MYKNKAFISYRHSPCDMKTAVLIQKRLEHFRIPKEIAASRKMVRIGRIFRDQTDLSAQSNLTEELRKELDDSEFLIVICSPDAVKSRWIREEILYFLENHSVAQVLPVLSAGEPVEVLNGIFGQIDGMPGELRACDCRGKKGQVIRDEIPRLAAALIGCSYDELIGRYRRYRQRRRAAAAVIVLACIAAVFAVSRIQISRIQNEELIRESVELARRSSESLEEHAQFDAIRYAMEALPGEEDERPVAGEAVLALQKAVGAYVPEDRKIMTQTDEYPVRGQIDDWDCMQTEKGCFITVLYYDGEKFALSIWETVSGRLTFDSLQENGEEAGSEDEENGSFLMTPEAVLWSRGKTITAIEPESGRVLWKEKSDNLYEQTILAAGRNIFAVYVYGGSEDRETEELQFRRLSDGKLLSGKTPEAAKINLAADPEGYALFPKAAFSNDDRSLILEADVFDYLDDSKSNSSLFSVDTKTFEESLLVREPMIYDYNLSEESGLLTYLCDVKNVSEETDRTGYTVCLKSIRIDTKEEVWKSRTIRTSDTIRVLPAELPADRTGDSSAELPAGGTGDSSAEPSAAPEGEDMQKDSSRESENNDIGGRGILLVSETGANLYEEETGREVNSLTIHSPAVGTFVNDTAGGKEVTIVTEDGSCYKWDYEKGDLSIRSDVLPASSYRAEIRGDSVFMYCYDENSADYEEKISLFREGIGDGDLRRLDLSGPAARSIPVPAGKSISGSSESAREMTQPAERESEEETAQAEDEESLEKTVQTENAENREETAQAENAESREETAQAENAESREETAQAENLDYYDYIFWTGVDGKMFLAETEAGDIFGIDASAGEIRWSVRPEGEYYLTGLSEQCGLLVLCMYPDVEGDPVWVLLDTQSGEYRTMEDPADGIRDPDRTVRGYLDMIVAGEYLEFAYFLENAEDDSDRKICLARYPLKGGEPDLVDITAEIGDEEEDYCALYGNESGTNTFCFFSSLDDNSKGRCLCVDWKTGKTTTCIIENDCDLNHSGSASWDAAGGKLSVMDMKNRVWIFGTDGSLSEWSAGRDLLSGKDAKQSETGETGKGNIAGFTFHNQEPVFVGAEKDGLRLREGDDESAIELPFDRAEVLSAFFDRFGGETKVSVTDLEEKKILLQCGDRVFVIDTDRKVVETSVGDVLGYNSAADVFLFRDGRGVRLAKRYSCSDLIRKGLAILQEDADP